jgi:hypothetical protein
MHVRAATTALLAAAIAIVIAGCGGAAPAGSSGGGAASTSSKAAVTGVLVQTDSGHPHGGKAVGGVKVGLYLQPVHAGGPIAADPPRPIATVMTGANGSFRFGGLRAGKRYYVFAVGARGYSTGHWTLPGQRVRLVACSDCVIPM